MGYYRLSMGKDEEGRGRYGIGREGIGVRSMRGELSISIYELH